MIQIEKRNFFSLFCLDLEAQLIHANLAQLIQVFKHLSDSQVKGHAEVNIFFVCAIIDNNTSHIYIAVFVSVG